MHNHTSHDILHHVFLSEIGMQNEEGSYTRQKLQKDLRGERRQIPMNQNLQRTSNLNQIGIRDVSPDKYNKSKSCAINI